MSRRPQCRWRLRLEPLEARLPLSLPPSADTFGITPPANALDISLGTVTRPGATGSTSVALHPKNITPNKHATEFGIFVRPISGSGLDPQIVAVEQDRRSLPLELRRPYRPREAGQPWNQAVAFFKTDHPGLVTIVVAGRKGTRGSYTVETTLVGDVNGDGQVNLADLHGFDLAYATKPAQPAYNLAADSNQNGIVNLYDALALERNMTPLTPPGPVNIAMNLAPADQAPYPTSQNSGGQTFKEFVTVQGYTTPGSIVLLDSVHGDYNFGRAALATDAQGFFQANGLQNQGGVTTFNFKVLDPFGHQSIRSFPVYWIAFARRGSNLKPPTHLTNLSGGQ